MNTSTNKMDSSEVYGMFETIKELLIKQKEKQSEKPIEPTKIEIDTATIDAATERFIKAAEEANKPSVVEHQHRHKIDIDIHSNWFFFSWVALVIVIFGLFWLIADQRETINQYSDNDLKYRYIKMQGQTNDENLYRLEHQFQYGDSIKIIRKQVERYEDLVKEQVERMERMKADYKETEELQNEAKSLRNRK